MLDTCSGSYLSVWEGKVGEFDHILFYDVIQVRCIQTHSRTPWCTYIITFEHLTSFSLQLSSPLMVHPSSKASYLHLHRRLLLVGTTLHRDLGQVWDFFVVSMYIGTCLSVRCTIYLPQASTVFLIHERCGGSHHWIMLLSVRDRDV